jgi:protein phosphatase
MSEKTDQSPLWDTNLLDVCGGVTDKGPVRKTNQDAFMLPDSLSPRLLGDIYIVADGVGGQEHGAEASQLAVRIIHDLFYQKRQAGASVAVALEQAADQANLAIYNEAQARGASRMGCTVVAAVHHNGQRTILHAGDARAYLLRDDELHQLTRDDTWVQIQVDEGIIGEETAANHELRHVVTRVLGNKTTLEITLSPALSIESGDTLLLCSDGLYDAVPSEKIGQILAGYTPQAAADTLVKLAVKANAKDNVTAVVVNSQHVSTEERTLAMTTVFSAADQELEAVLEVPAEGDAEDADAQQQRSGFRLPLWALAVLFLAIIFTVIFGASALWRQLIRPEEPLPTAAVPAATPKIDTPAPIIPTAAPVDTAIPEDTAVPPSTLTSPPQPTATLIVTETSPTVTPEPSETPLPPTNTPQPTATIQPIAACIVNPDGPVYVWQDDQVTNSDCDQFAREGFILNDNDPISILDPNPITILGPDTAFCQENELIRVQSTADSAIVGWVLIDVVQVTTAEQGCPP